MINSYSYFTTLRTKKREVVHDLDINIKVQSY